MTKTFFGRVLAGIGHFFTHLVQNLFNSAEKAYNNLPPATQAALKNGSGVMALIGQTLLEAPADVVEAIKQAFPSLDDNALASGLLALIEAWNLTPASNSIEDLITAIQKHLTPKEGSIWDSLLNEGAQLLAYALSPSGTVFGVIAMLMEWVYDTFFRGKSLVPPVNNSTNG